MKALLLNGSPRKGNTHAALEALKRGFLNIDDLQIRQIDAADASVSPCIACGSCGKGGDCIFDDDTNEIMDAVDEADILVFATPVYWWGMTAQMKLVIDKFYSRQKTFKNARKQVGIIVIGQLSQDNPQYEIIPKQFSCICDYLGWDIAFCNTYSADEPGDLSGSADTVAEIEALWKKLKI